MGIPQEGGGKGEQQDCQPLGSAWKAVTSAGRCLWSPGTENLEHSMLLKYPQIARNGDSD